MKNLLILIVAAAIFLHFYPQPKLEKWAQEQKETALSLFSNATDTKVRLKSDKILEDLQPELNQFNEEEVEYLKEITKSRHSVNEFYTEYCGTQKVNVRLHNKNQQVVCKTISKYQALL